MLTLNITSLLCGCFGCSLIFICSLKFCVDVFLLKFTCWTAIHAPPLPLIGKITLSPLLQMEDSEEEEQEEEASEEFNVIPPYSEKDSNIESGARGSKQGAATRAVPVFPLLLLPIFILDWECWSYWSLHLILRSYFTPATTFRYITALRGLLRERNAPFLFPYFFIFKNALTLLYDSFSLITASLRVKRYQ